MCIRDRHKLRKKDTGPAAAGPEQVDADAAIGIPRDEMDYHRQVLQQMAVSHLETLGAAKEAEIGWRVGIPIHAM